MSSQVDDLLASRLGRQVVYAALGFPTQELYRRCGLANAPGTATLASRPVAAPVPQAPPVKRSTWSEVPAAEARQAVRSLVEVGRWRELEDMPELELLASLANETGSFGFRGEDEWLWGLTALAVDELAPVADMLLTCTAARNWWRPTVRHDQRILSFEPNDTFRDRHLTAAIAQATTDHKSKNASRRAGPSDERDRQQDEANGIRYGANWWSTPPFTWRAVSVGPFEGIPSIALLDFIDAGSWSGVASVIRFATAMDERIYEVNGPQDWASLVERYPMDVTGTHNGEWRYWGGVNGPWLLPDWARASEDYDGIHISIGGYVTTSGRALPVANGYTMLAGWEPDGTLWLTDTSTDPSELGTWDFSEHRAFDFYDDEPLGGWSPSHA